MGHLLSPTPLGAPAALLRRSDPPLQGSGGAGHVDTGAPGEGGFDALPATAARAPEVSSAPHPATAARRVTAIARDASDGGADEGGEHPAKRFRS